MFELFTPAVLTGFAICTAAAMATTLGAFSVFSAKESNPRLLAFGLAFAGGAMVYISFVEIFWKSLDSFAEAFEDKQAYSYATFAFFGGIILLALIDRLIPNPHNGGACDYGAQLS